jgi:uncharacterized protein YjbI with pentapeptide repeats/DNA replication protein DnaC
MLTWVNEHFFSRTIQLNHDPETKTFPIFIVYEDNTGIDLAVHIKQTLEKRGILTFVAKQDIPKTIQYLSDEWRKQIDRAIASCNVFVIVLSSAKLTSEMTREVLLAFERKKTDNSFALMICRFVQIPRRSSDILSAVGVDTSLFQQVDFADKVDLARLVNLQIDDRGFAIKPKRSAREYSIEQAQDHPLELTGLNKNAVNKSLREYCLRIVDQYENFYSQSETRPVIEQLSKFDFKKYFVSISARDLDRWNINDAVDMIMRWLQEDERKGLLLLGDFGTGKSTLGAFIAVKLAKQFPKTRKRAPIFIPLRVLELVSKESLLNAVNVCLKTDWETLSELSESGNLVFILDGFDEILKRTDWNKTLSDFQAIVELLLNGKSKVIVTCRTHYFLKDSAIWGDETSLMERARATKDFRIMNIEPLTEPQILEFLKRRMDNPGATWEQIKGTYNLADLCKRPLLVDMILTTLPALVASGKRIDPATLYDTYTGIWIKQEDWRSQLEPAQKSNLMEEIAYEMLAKRETLILPADSIREIIKTKLKTKAKSEVADYFDYDIRTCSFFNRDSEGNYGFMHRSFLEFFVAKPLSKEINDGSFRYLQAISVSPEIAYFASFLIDPASTETLWNALYSTKGKPLNEAGRLGGNAVKLLRAIGADMKEKDFTRCAIEDAELGELANCNFDKTQLRNVSFEAGNISDCTFRRSRLESCKFSEAKLSNVSFSKSKLVSAAFENSELRACSLREAKLSQCVLYGAKINGSDMTNVVFEKISTQTDAPATMSNLGAEFLQSHLRSSRFIGSDLLMSAFRQSDLKSSKFSDCNLRGCLIDGCDFRQSRIRDGSASFAVIVRSRCSQTKFTGTRLYSTYIPRAIHRQIAFDHIAANKPCQSKSNLRREDGMGVQDLAALCALDNAVEKLRLSDSIEKRAISVYFATKPSRSVYERIEIMAACFNSVSRSSGLLVTLTEISTSFGVRSKGMNRTYRKLLAAGKIKRVPLSVLRCIDELAEKTRVKKKSVALARRLFRLARREAVGRNPFTVAAATLYYACKMNGEKLTVFSIASAADVTEVAIRNFNKILAIHAATLLSKKTK